MNRVSLRPKIAKYSFHMVCIYLKIMMFLCSILEPVFSGKSHVAENLFVLALSSYNRLASILVQSCNCSWGGTWLLNSFILVLCLCSKPFFLCFLQPFLDIVLYIFKLTSAIGAQVNKRSGFFRTISTFSLL